MGLNDKLPGGVRRLLCNFILPGVREIAAVINVDAMNLTWNVAVVIFNDIKYPATFDLGGLQLGKRN